MNFKNFLFYFLISIIPLYPDSNNFVELNTNYLNVISLLKEVSSKDFMFEPYLYLKPVEFLYSQMIMNIDCNDENPEFLKDKSGRFSILRKDIYLVEERFRNIDFNNRICFFKDKKNKLLIPTKSNNWPYLNNEKFSISIYIKPLISLKTQTIFDWTNYNEENIKTFKIQLKQQSINLLVKNIIKDHNNFYNLDVSINNAIQLNEWNHLFFTVNLKEKKILVFLNNKLLKWIQLPEDSYFDFKTIYPSPIQIGENYIGYMDDLLILNDFFEYPITYYPYTPISVIKNSGRISEKLKNITSLPIKISSNIEKLIIKWKYLQPEGTIIKIQYRQSHTIEDIFKTEWKNVNNFREDSTDKELEIQKKNLQRFIQFKISMLQDSAGFYSPILYYLNIDTIKSKVPPRVYDLKVISELSNEEQVCIEWEKVPDEDIEINGGYKIHIGINNQSEIILDKILINQEWKKINKTNTEFPLTDKEKELEKFRPFYWRKYKNNHIRVILKKNTLEEFKNYNLSQNDLHINRIKLIWESDVIYYFRISTYLYELDNQSELSDSIIYKF